MELGIRVKGEFLELLPNASLELEEDNPFLQMGDQLTGEHSLPLGIPATENNMRLLGYPHILNAHKNNAGIEAIAYYKGAEHSSGYLKLETGNGHINNPSRGIINVYYKYGLSAFWELVSRKYLTDVNYGPDISHPYTTKYGQTLDGGFFAHIRQVMNAAPGAYDYAFFPVLNTLGLRRYPNRPGTFVLNNVVFDEGDTNTIYPAYVGVNQDWSNVSVLGPKNELCPFPYITFVIEKLFAHFGYRVDGTILQDNDFKKAVLLHTNYIDFVDALVEGEGTPVTWNLKSMMPRVKIGTFLIGLANRFGWWYDWDYTNKVVNIRQRKDVMADRKRLEVTTRAGAAYNFNIKQVDKVYSLISATGEDKFTFDADDYKGTVSNRYQLPVPTDAQEDDIYFVKGENSYLRCTQNENNEWIWEKAGDNTFNYKVAGSTDDISTNCVIPGSDIAAVGNISNFSSLDRKMIVPLIEMGEEAETEIFSIAYNFGKVDLIHEAGQPNYIYPMGSAGCQDNYGNPKTGKSLAFEYPESSITDRGVYVNAWKAFLSFLQQSEEITIPVAFSREEMMNLTYADTLIIRNVEYLIKNPHFSVPLKPFTPVDLIRL